METDKNKEVILDGYTMEDLLEEVQRQKQLQEDRNERRRAFELRAEVLAFLAKKKYPNHIEARFDNDWLYSNDMPDGLDIPAKDWPIARRLMKQLKNKDYTEYWPAEGQTPLTKPTFTGIPRTLVFDERERIRNRSPLRPPTPRISMDEIDDLDLFAARRLQYNKATPSGEKLEQQSGYNENLTTSLKSCTSQTNLDTQYQDEEPKAVPPLNTDILKVHSQTENCSTPWTDLDSLLHEMSPNQDIPANHPPETNDCEARTETSRVPARKTAAERREELDEMDSILRETEHLNQALYTTHSDKTLEKRFENDAPWTDDVTTAHSSGYIPTTKPFGEVESSREISKRPNVPVDGHSRRGKTRREISDTARDDRTLRDTDCNLDTEVVQSRLQPKPADAESSQLKKKGKKKKRQRPSKIDQGGSRDNQTGTQVDHSSIDSQVKVNKKTKDKHPDSVCTTNRDNGRHKKDKVMNGFQTEFKKSAWQIKKKRQSRQKDLDHQTRNRNTGIESRAANRTLDRTSGRGTPVTDKDQSPLPFPEPEPIGNTPSQSSLSSPQYSLKLRILNNVRNGLTRLKNKVNAFCCCL